MRLTLRTLLAWVDEVLPADEQRQLGEKVGESPIARQLVERIGAVVANDQLGAPRLGARGLAGDANSVAEYLDNALPPERLESFETICLESDVHLAEVAACHAILAEVARDPAVLQPLDDEGRRALLESIEHRMKDHPEVLLGGAAAPTAAAKEARRERSATRGGSHAGGVAMTPVAPEPARSERRRTPWGAWGTLAGSLLLLGVLAALFARSAGLFPSPAKVPALPDREVAGGAQAVREQAALPEVPADAVVRADAEPAMPADAVAAREVGADVDAIAARPDAARPDDVEGSAPAADAAMDEAAGEQADEPIVDEPADAAAMADAEPADDRALAAAPQPPAAPGPRKVRAGEALAIAAGVRPAKPAPNGAAPAAEDSVADDVGLEGQGASAGIGFVAADGVVLVRVADGDLVRVEPAGVGAAIVDGAEVVVPPGMRPEINLGGLSVRLQPRSIVRLATDADGTPRVSLVEGRLVARSARIDARLAIDAGGLDGRVVAGLEGGVAVETFAEWDRGQGDGEVPSVARVIAVGRPLGWSPVGGTEKEATTIPLQGTLEWTSSSGVAENGAAGRPADWIAGAERLDKLERTAAETFARRLEALPPGSTPAAGLEQVLDGMAIDRRVENRIFAGLSRSLLDDYATAVDLLCAEAPGRKLEPGQWAALEAAVVPLALARGQGSPDRLERAWQEQGPPGRAEMLMAMGRGPTDAALADGFDSTLVDALADDALVVRRYALAVLADVTRPSTFDRARFRPDAPPESRREGASWWRTQQEKGLVRRAR